MVLYTGYGLGNIMTTITTNSAYKISSHVIIAHIMPHMSYSNTIQNVIKYMKSECAHGIEVQLLFKLFSHLNTPGASATTAIMHVSAVKQFVFIIHITNVTIFLGKHQQQR